MTPNHQNANPEREVLACLMCSPIYFDLPLSRRLALLKSMLSDSALCR